MDQPLAVLYVEDDPDIQEIGRIALEEIGGLTVRLCADGEQALQAVRDFRPDLLLLDVMMPGMDGPTLLGKLREIEATAKVPAVFMTARVQSNEIEQYLQLGAIQVVPKPFDPLTLGADLRTLIAGHTRG